MEHTVYLVMALVGGVILLIQVVLQVIGLGGEADVGDVGADGADGVDADVDADAAHSGNLFFGILSFKAIIGFCAFFGLTGLSLLDKDMGVGMRVALSCCAGFVAMFVIAWMMRALYSLQASGTMDVRRVVGHTAGVYLRIPAKSHGKGKVTVEVEGRSIEIEAVTDGDAIPTGGRVRILEMVGDDCVKVELV